MLGAPEMLSTAEYLAKAQECLDAAIMVDDLAMRDKLSDLAHRWMMLAAERDKHPENRAS